MLLCCSASPPVILVYQPSVHDLLPQPIDEDASLIVGQVRP
jgi:hypothetical protein